MGGMLGASLLLSIYQLPWFFMARILVPYSIERGFKARFVAIICLSCTWVSIEWLRCQFTLGFPWCPLSVTQWERPILLQTAKWFGGWIVSFFLIFFNLCLGSYVHHLFVRRRQSSSGIFGNICPDFYLAILLFVFMLSPFFLIYKPESKVNHRFDVGVCQPYLLEKWKGGNAALHKDILSRQTSILGLMKPDLIVWPEASTPYALNKDSAWVEELVKQASTPLLLGAVLKEGESIYNTISEVLPDSGFKGNRYAKRVLVPFGEYIPFPFKFIPGLRKMVGPVGSFKEGEDINIFSIPTSADESVKIGPLICYEDIFPSLCLDVARKGVDLFFVTTNDAWFGEEGCAKQHAAHSVLRAVETQRPFIRCGNAGWSGWIDSNGYQREVLKDENGSIYCARATVMNLVLNLNPQRQKSFYVKRGDLFAYFCVLVSILSCISLGFKVKY
jgi:apolipoprotein N-acyltransferase